MIVAGLAIARAWGPSIGKFLFSRTGLLTTAAAAVFIFYEGLPLGPLRWIPTVGPYLETWTDGRVDAERKRGAAQERIAWEEARRKLLLKLEQERRAAQSAIDAAELQYLEQRDRDVSRIQALEAAIDQEPVDAEDPACPPRPAIPGGVSKSLNAIGR